MKCKYSEKDIALFVERDVPRPMTGVIEAHLASCDACRALAADLIESQGVFKTLRQDIVSQAALSSLRSRVLSELETGNVKPAWGRWVYALAGIACLAMMWAGLRWYVRIPALPEKPAVAQVVPPPAELSKHEAGNSTERAAAMVPPAKRRSSKPPQAPTPAPQDPDHAETPAEPSQPQQLVVKLLTDDPNIVIYWLVEQNGGGL